LKRSRLSQIFAALLVNSIYEMKNYPIVLINTIFSPISLLLVITFVSKGALFNVAIEGGLITSMFSGGMALQSDLSHLKNNFKLQDMIVSSPTTSRTYAIGMALSEVTYSLPALIILSLLAAIYIHPTVTQTFELIAVLFLMFLSSTAIGFMLSTISSDIVQSFAFTRLLSTLFSTLPPVYYPITYIPLSWRYIAYLSPTTYAAEIAQNTIGYQTIAYGTLIVDWVVLVVATIVILFITVKKTRWKEV
jgi:ABC-2 type transport system permease protein